MTLRYEKRERPVTISSVSPSASAVSSELLPLYLNGNTATQKPSSSRQAARTPLESAAASVREVEVPGAANF
jgi:hypothetical protein